MHKIALSAFGALGASVLLVLSCGGAPESTGGGVESAVKIEVGLPFPTLLLPRLSDGKPGSIADFRGKKTMLHVFASW